MILDRIKYDRRGFTLLTILLIIGIIAILAGIVILIVNPTRQLGEARNAKRRSDVLTILNAAYQYKIDNNGTLPEAIVISGECALGMNREINLGRSNNYLTSLPSDPLATSSDKGVGSGYAVSRSASGRITVCAPLAEKGVIIRVTK